MTNIYDAIEDHCVSVILEHIQSEEFNNDINFNFVEKYYDTVNEKIIEDCYAKIQTGNCGVFLRIFNSSGIDNDVAGYTSNRSISIEFLCISSPNVEKFSINKRRITYQIASIVEKLMKDNPIKNNVNLRKQITSRFSFVSHSNILRISNKQRAGVLREPIDILLLKLKLPIRGL
jgi:hypothetical protein